MKFLADECCDPELISKLRHAGFDVAYVLEFQSGADDTEVLTYAFDEERILITEDKDFGELVYRLHKPTNGIILLRIPVEQRNQKPDRLIHAINTLGNKLRKNFIVIELETIRIRPL